jgi:hypothetical protein
MEVPMHERRIKSYFKQQVHTILERSVAEPDGACAYFLDHEPKDEEILGLLAISTVLSGSLPGDNGFPTPLEALAALSLSSRAEICRAFRRELKTFARSMAHA